MLSSIKDHIIQYRDRAALTGMVVGLTVCIGVGIYLQKHGSKPEIIPVKEIKKVELEVKKSGGNEGNSSATGGKDTFYLRPSAQELLQQLAGMENLLEDVAQEKFRNLRVLWPVYFFSMKPSGADEQLILDISETGFGAVVTGAVKDEDYPALKEKQPGDRLWVAGEIVGVDPSGTGTIHLDIGLLDFSTDGPILSKQEETTPETDKGKD